MTCEDCPRFIGVKPCNAGSVLLGRKCVGAYTVCNLSTGGFLHLPPCRTGVFPSTAGIGYRSATGEYKVVQLGLMANIPPWEGLDCQVLTVNDFRGWRPPAGEAAGLRLPGLIVEDRDPVFANGCLHWTLLTVLLVRDKPEGILCFSLASESFSTLPVPPFLSRDLVPVPMGEAGEKEWSSRPRFALSTDHRLVRQPVGTTLAELDGCPCMIRDLCRCSDTPSSFKVWKLNKDYQESGDVIWTLDYRINLTGSIMADRLMEPWLVFPLCYLERSDHSSSFAGEKRKLVLLTMARDVHVYDPETSTLQTTQCCVDTSSSHDSLLPLVLYQESLVHITGMEYAARNILLHAM